MSRQDKALSAIILFALVSGFSWGVGFVVWRMDTGPHPVACWSENKVTMPEERICGSVDKAPEHAYNFGDRT